MPQGGRRERELPDGFVWKLAYDRIKQQREADAARGDTYAAAAGTSALDEIDRAVMGAYSTHAQKTTFSRQRSTSDILGSVRKMRGNARYNGKLPRAREIERTVEGIDRLTHALDTQLRFRLVQFQSAAPRAAVPVPDRESLGQWLQMQADLARGSELERSYFTQLVQELPRGRDPWMVSRELMERLPSPGNAKDAERLQAAHLRLVQAIACGPSEQPSESSSLEPPRGFKWQVVFDKIKAGYERATSEGDIYAAAAGAAALSDIEQAVMCAYFEHRSITKPLSQCSPANALQRLRDMRRNARYAGNQTRFEAVQRSLDNIDRLTHVRHAELDVRRYEFRWKSLGVTGPLPGREALGRWLQTQADADSGSELEHSYFAQLAQENFQGRDLWTVSRELMRRLPSPGDVGQTVRLRAAHDRLVRSMAGSLPQRAAVHPPVVAQASGGSLAPASIQQEMIGRLNNRNPLSDRQVQILVSAVARANQAGAFDLATSQPEVWAKNLVDRVQTSFQGAIEGRTESDGDQKSSDLRSLGELIERLGGQGYL